jgi:hypothetical protein
MDDCYGLCENGFSQYYNLTKLWQDYEDEDDFIEVFAQTVLHELLHEEIRENISDLFEEREEEIIETMGG